MKLTSSQLRKIIAEEVSKVLNEGDDTLTPGRLALGSLADISEIEKAKAALYAAKDALDAAKAALESLRMNIEQNAIKEGNNSEEAEDFARDGLTELFKEVGEVGLAEMFKEYMQSIGYMM